MQFLLVTQYYPPEIGAAPIRLSAIVRELVARGHGVEVITSTPNYPAGRTFAGYRGVPYRREQRDGATIHRVWSYPARGLGLKRLVNYGSFVLASTALTIAVSRPDVVFVESPPLFSALTGVFAAWLHQALFVFNVSDLWPDSLLAAGMLRDGAALRLARGFEAWTYRHAGVVNAVTGGIARDLVESKGLSPAQVLMLGNGADTATFRPAPADPAVAARYGLTGKQVVLYAGTHSLITGMDVIAEAARLLAARGEIVFCFVGDGPAKRGLIEQFRAAGLTNGRFLDPVQPQEVARLYHLACAGLSTMSPSPLAESTRPAKIFPALASGVPVIYSGAGDGARIIAAAQAGIVTPPGDAAALARAVEAIVDDPVAARAMGARGRRLAEEQYSWHAIIGAWLDQLEQRVHERRAS